MDIKVETTMEVTIKGQKTVLSRDDAVYLYNELKAALGIVDPPVQFIPNQHTYVPPMELSPNSMPWNPIHPTWCQSCEDAKNGLNKVVPQTQLLNG